MSKDIDVLAVGEPLIEFNQRAAGNHSYDIGYGGDTSNCAIAAARLGAVAAYVTRVGDDAFGQRLMALWAAEGVITQGYGAVAPIPDRRTVLKRMGSGA